MQLRSAQGPAGATGYGFQYSYMQCLISLFWQYRTHADSHAWHTALKDLKELLAPLGMVSSASHRLANACMLSSLRSSVKYISTPIIFPFHAAHKEPREPPGIVSLTCMHDPTVAACDSYLLFLFLAMLTLRAHLNCAVSKELKALLALLGMASLFEPNLCVRWATCNISSHPFFIMKLMSILLTQRSRTSGTRRIYWVWSHQPPNEIFFRMHARFLASRFVIRESLIHADLFRHTVPREPREPPGIV
jgi:hypothetical protein